MRSLLPLLILIPLTVHAGPRDLKAGKGSPKVSSKLVAHLSHYGTLKSGSRGPAVKELQRRLAMLGYSINPDGAYGRNTAKVVQAFQKKLGLRTTGTVSSLEVKALRSTEKRVRKDQGLSKGDCDLLDEIAKGRTLRLGDKGPAVLALQKRLSYLGFPVPSTNRFDKKTDRALGSFQSTRNLTVNGILTERTAQILIKASSKHHKEPKWMKTARRETGVQEHSGSKHNPRIIAYHATTSRSKKDETPWCSSFVSWVMENTRLPSTKRGNARSWLKYGRKLEKPIPGCIVIFWREDPKSWKGHVGFYLAEESSSVVVFGGNQSNTVKVSRYKKSRVLGYRWPKNVPLPK